MAPLKAGQEFPKGVSFGYIPYTPETANVLSCGIPITLDASKEFKNKKVVLVAVPGAFTPTCTANHLPGFIKNIEKLKSKGVDTVAFVAYNDAFVMSAWGKASGVKGDDILFISDADSGFSKEHAWTMGERTGRYAMIIDHGKVTYSEAESGKEVTVSGADAVLKHL